MPAAVAARPRDERGYPVPAITPWSDGGPQFAQTGVARTFLCAVERRCSICGVVMPDGPIWRVVGGAEASAIESSLRSGQTYRNRAPTAEAPGHRSCMLYAAIVCPWLARPNARRGEADRGTSRGQGGAVVGFATYEFAYAEIVEFRFAGLTEFLRHDLGEEQLPALLAADPVPAEPVPAYLRSDEAAANRAFETYLRRFSS